MSYRQLSWNLEAARLGFIMILSHWSLTGISAVLLRMCLSSFRAIKKLLTWISRHRDLTRSCSKTSVRLLSGGPEKWRCQSLIYKSCNCWYWRISINGFYYWNSFSYWQVYHSFLTGHMWTCVPESVSELGQIIAFRRYCGMEWCVPARKWLSGTRN